MFRRLHFLLPNAKLAQNVVNELLSLGINSQQIHTYAEHNQPIESLRPATENQSHDKAQKIENIIWLGNLILFGVFLSLFIVSIISSYYLFSLACLGVMLISFASGNFFARHIPHVHFNQFKDALSHNELLMMIDIPDDKVDEIESSIHRHHPAAIEGGSSWMIKSADI